MYVVPDQSGKVAVVTGANSGTGQVTRAPGRWGASCIYAVPTRRPAMRRPAHGCGRRPSAFTGGPVCFNAEAA
jgi:NAD(P)-dependent dehydrogenase (short-subunit alcohol dehydrogenase family)